MHADNSGRRLAPWLVVLFVTILGAKLWTIQVYGTDLPYWDQWDEAQYFFQPWLAGRLTWSDWFAPHNEHRIFFTRLLDWGELWLNGQWDPRLQMVVNAGLHAGFACGLAACLWAFTVRRSEALICTVLLPLFALPFAAENTIHGFQSQMYFVEIFSLAAMVGLAFCRVGGAGWWGGLAVAVAAIFTMGSGFLAAVAVVGLMLCRGLRARRVLRSEVLVASAALAVVILGLALNSTPALSRQFQARSLSQFCQALSANLAWPFSDQPWLIPVLWLPLLVLLVGYFRGDIKRPRAAEFVLLLAGWGLLQAVALAFGRARMAGSCRYFDVLSLLPLANLASLFVLRENPGLRECSAAMRSFLAVAWSSLLLLGLWQCTRTVQEDYLIWSRSHGLADEKNIRTYLAADARTALSQPLGPDVPYYDVQKLQALLNDKSLSAILPPACRRPLALAAASPDAGGFVRAGVAPELPPPPGVKIWGSYTTNAAGQTGTFLSQPLQARLPQLMLPVVCGETWAGLQLRWIGADGRQHELVPEVIGRWHQLIFAAPPGPFRLEISDTNPAAWIAVGDISEAGTLTVAALRLTDQAVPLLLVGWCGFILLGAWLWLRPASSLSERLVLPVAVMALVGVWLARDFNEAALAAQLEQTRAAEAASRGDWAGAAGHWRDALYFHPDDPATLAKLADWAQTNSALPRAEADQLAAVYRQAAAKLKPELAARPAVLP